MIEKCPCCSGRSYAECCQPFVLGIEDAASPEQLMRSRYTAYAIGAIDHLIRTTHPSSRKRFSRKEIEQWSRSNRWLKLEVLAVKDDHVEFNAYYVQGLSPIQVHHEHSRFKKEDGIWYYVDHV